MSATERLSSNGKVPRKRFLGRSTRELFLSRLDRVCDGSVYTEDRLQKILGIGRTNVQNFVYMCEVFPGVAVKRLDTSSGRKTKIQYQFARVEADQALTALSSMLERSKEESNVVRVG